MSEFITPTLKGLYETNTSAIRAAYKDYKSTGIINMARGDGPIAATQNLNTVSYPGGIQYAIPVIYGQEIMRLAEPTLIWFKYAAMTDSSMVAGDGNTLVLPRQIFFTDVDANKFMIKEGYIGNPANSNSDEDKYSLTPTAQFTYENLIFTPPTYFLATTWTDQLLEDFSKSLGPQLTELMLNNYSAHIEVFTVAAITQAGPAATPKLCPYVTQCTADFAIAPGNPVPYTTVMAAAIEQFEDVTANSKLSFNAVLVSSVHLDNLGYTPSIAVITPIQVGQLLSDPNFHKANEYGSREALIDGRITRIAGVDIAKSRYNNAGFATATGNGTFARIDGAVAADNPKVTGQVAVMFDKSRAYMYVWKRFLRLETKRDPQTEITYLVGTMRWGAFRIDPNATVLMVSGSVIA